MICKDQIALNVCKSKLKAISDISNTLTDMLENYPQLTPDDINLIIIKLSSLRFYAGDIVGSINLVFDKDGD